MESTINTAISEPAILSAGTYFWSAAGNASSRRRNEERHVASVAAYFAAIGLDVAEEGCDHVTGRAHDLSATFSYSESCKNVYKSLRVVVAGKPSNITQLRRLAHDPAAFAAAAAKRRAKAGYVRVTA